ncbi:unnamed protein product (macronuclear) [Paramecium tetraurelia]|uniref:SKP1 component dimerisation domain-containing protein n=1 Tax=Paramecium tetraurelia TaxID=5888 RepID=A0CG50_PARTE|nr:uncharacterized protein GSPATT00038211001 [Paramecium tetraurelia]CAK69767.1 unnamed protein product [Paramecium tetraurelia]|eukprot:XP_001437164.1 hypothetical protein (macronuclear) [Paramecium tetraurelia strain d4-2]
MIINTLDDKQVNIPVPILQKFSKTNSQIQENSRNKTIFNFKVESVIVIKVVDFLQKLLTSEISIIPKPVPNGKIETYLNEIECNFLKSITPIERQTILKLADDLGLEHLSNLMLASFACEFVGCTTQEFLKKCNINVEYTPELEKEIQKQFDTIIKRN